MSKGIYIGNSNAKKVKKMYLGNGTSRKVKKGYIGVGNVAKLFYSSGYVWKKYNTNTTNTYHWNKYSITTKIDGHTLGWGPTEDIDVARNERIYSSIEFDSDRGDLRIDRNSGEMVYEVIYDPRDDNLDALIGWYQAPTRPTIVNDCYKIVAVYGTRGNLVIECGGKYCEIEPNETEERGSLLGSVTSTSRNTYPTNGISGSYWYVYDRQDTSYSQGSYIQDVENDNPNAYPDNGRHSDGYWYVKQSE